MFIVTQKPTFTAPVVAKIPTDGGKFTTARFSVVFKALTKPEVDELLKRIRDRAQESTQDGGVELLKDREVLEEVLVGFGPDLVEEDRTPMVFNATNVERLCSIYPLEAAMVKSFFENYVNGPAKN